MCRKNDCEMCPQTDVCLGTGVRQPEYVNDPLGQKGIENAVERLRDWLDRSDRVYAGVKVG
jgi:hypothetical protein